MKRVISLILIIIVVIAISIAWYKIDSAMEIEPYKKQSIDFISTLKQSRAMDAQVLLGRELQYAISVDDIVKFIHDTGIKNSKEIVWGEIVDGENHYTLLANIQLEDGNTTAMEIRLTKIAGEPTEEPEESTEEPTKEHAKKPIKVDKILIGEVELKPTINLKRAFFQ